MNRRKWLWAAVLAVPAMVAGGLTYANTQKAGKYTCPVTGEELLCPDCCPFNQPAATPAAKQPKPDAVEGYVCPITGERLGCPGCCPLNQKKQSRE